MSPGSRGDDVAAARVVDLLGQRLDRVEAGDEHRQPGEHDERRRPRPGAAEGQPGDHPEQPEARDARARPAEQALHAAGRAPGTGRPAAIGRGSTDAAAGAPGRAVAAARRRCAGPAWWRRSGAGRRGATVAPPPRGRCDRAGPGRRPRARSRGRSAPGRGQTTRAARARARRRARPVPTPMRAEPVGDAQADEHHPEHGRHPGPQLQPAGHERRAGGERDERGAGQRTGADPGRRGPLDAVVGELTGDGTGDGADEHQEPESPDRRRAERRGAIHRREQHVSHLGPLERERPAEAARPEADGDHERRQDAEPRRAVLQQVVGLGGGEGGVTDDAREHHDHDHARRCR